MMSAPLARSITSGAANNDKWRTHETYFYPSESGNTPGCVNLSPAWFMQGHPVSQTGQSEQHILTSFQAPQFHPHVSATLKGDGGALCQAIQRPAVLIAAALRVMHPKLYWSSFATQLALGLWVADKNIDQMGDRLREWASVFTALSIVSNRWSPLHRDPLSRPQWFDAMTTIGNYGVGRMKMPNLGIEIQYDPGCIAAGSGRIIRHGVNKVAGDQIAWVWYMRDDVQEFVDIPRADYSKYHSVVADIV